MISGAATYVVRRLCSYYRTTNAVVGNISTLQQTKKETLGSQSRYKTSYCRTSTYMPSKKFLVRNWSDNLVVGPKDFDQ